MLDIPRSSQVLMMLLSSKAGAKNLLTMKECFSSSSTFSLSQNNFQLFSSITQSSRVRVGVGLFQTFMGPGVKIKGVGYKLAEYKKVSGKKMFLITQCQASKF